MIGKAKACKGGSSLFRYILDEKKGYELDRNLVSGTGASDINNDFEILSANNTSPRTTNTILSMVLSPDIKDGQEASEDELRSMSRDFLKGLGIDYEKTQYMSFVHVADNHIKHNHIHILVNRVDPATGKLFSDKWIGKKAQWAAHEIALERGLVSAKSLMIESLKRETPLLDKDWKTKREIWNHFKNVMDENPNISLNHFIESMLNRGVQINLTLNKKGEIQGYRVLHLHSQIEFKASEVNRKMAIGNMLKQGMVIEPEKILNPPLQKSYTGMLSKFLLYQASKRMKENLKENSRENDE